VTGTCDIDVDECVFTLNQGTCKIGGQCFAPGEFTTDGCSSCSPERSQTAWTPGDRGEPDNGPATANALTNNNQVLNAQMTTGWNGPWLTSRLWPAADVDAFTWSQAGSLGAPVPIVSVGSRDSLALEVCLYVRCRPSTTGGEMTTTRLCPTFPSIAESTLNDGWLGCCLQSSEGTRTLRLNQAFCQTGTTFPTDATRDVLATVRNTSQAEAAVCEPYEFHWGQIQ